MATFIIFLLFAGALFFVYYKYDSTVANQKKQLMLLSKQNKDLKNKLNYKNTKYANIKVKYTQIAYSEGVVNSKCNLNLAPIKNYLSINNLEKDMKVNIIDSANILGTLWFRVQLNTDENINSKGWISEKNLTLIKVSSNQNPDNSSSKKDAANTDDCGDTDIEDFDNEPFEDFSDNICENK